MFSPHRAFAWTLSIGCLAAATTNAQQPNVRWNQAQRPNVPRGLGGGMRARAPLGAAANNFGGIPGAGFFNMPFGAPGFPGGLNAGAGGGVAGFGGMGGVAGMAGGMGGLPFPGNAPVAAAMGFNNSLIGGPFGNLGINNSIGNPLGGMYGNGPFGNPLNNPLNNPFNNSMSSPFANPFLSTLNSPLNGAYLGNGFNGVMGMNPGFSNPFNAFP